jgi:hypothetical protein
MDDGLFPLIQQCDYKLETSNFRVYFYQLNVIVFWRG